MWLGYFDLQGCKRTLAQTALHLQRKEEKRRRVVDLSEYGLQFRYLSLQNAPSRPVAHASPPGQRKSYSML